MTVHGRDEVMIVSVEEYRSLRRDPNGAALVEALQASPFRDVDIEPRGAATPVRGVPL